MNRYAFIMLSALTPAQLAALEATVLANGSNCAPIPDATGTMGLLRLPDAAIAAIIPSAALIIVCGAVSLSATKAALHWRDTGEDED